MILLLAALAAPAAAQTTVTSIGREGSTACLGGQSEINAGNMPISALTTTSISYTTPAVTWNEYVGRLGDTTPPININFKADVYDARTKASVNTITYTMNVAPNTSGRNSGCFSISPLTVQDVRNCWCGRENTLPLFRSAQNNTDWHNMWGCR